MPNPKDQSTLIKQLISGTAPGQTIVSKSGIGGDETGLPPGWQTAIDLINEAATIAAASDSAATALQESLARAGLDIQRGQLGVQQGQLAEQGRQFDISQAEGIRQFGLSLGEGARQFDINQAFLTGQEEFRQQDVNAQRLLEAAGLATGPTGAIQLASLARGEGAPQAEVASIFQHLPFVQELLHGRNVPGFGLPEQLGGEMRRVPAGGGTIEGKNLGVTIPGKKSITQQAYGSLSAFEQEFLGALGQSETGQSIEGFLQDIMKSFIPTRNAGALSIA